MFKRIAVPAWALLCDSMKIPSAGAYEITPDDLCLQCVQEVMDEEERRKQEAEVCSSLLLLVAGFFLIVRC